MSKILWISGVLMVPVTIALAQGPVSYSHVYDSTYRVTAYELTPEQESQFDSHDGRLTPFWEAWSTEQGRALDVETINGVDHYTWGDTATSREEGMLSVRFAYGDAGIYILFTAQDDSWAGYTHWLDYANDAVELFGCQVSAREMYENPAVYLPCQDRAPYHQMNAFYAQVQIRFGLVAHEPVESFSHNYWNPMLTNLAEFGCGHGNILYEHDPTFDGYEAIGWKIEVMPLFISNARHQEWLIPWSQWGGPSPPGCTRKREGEAVGICFGYNDFDPGDSVSTALRWRRCDPYSNTDWNRPAGFTGDTTVNTALDAWGEIYFGPKLADIVPSSTQREAEGRGVRNLPLLIRAVKITPSSLMLNLALPSGTRAPVDFSVFDTRGRSVLQQSVTGVGDCSMTIPLRNRRIGPGSYVIQVKAESQVVRRNVSLR